MDVQYTREILNRISIEDLKRICQNNNIRGYNHISKSELVTLIMNEQTNRKRVRTSLIKNIYNYFMSNMSKIFCNTDKYQRIITIHPEFEDVEEENIEKQCVICFVNKRIFAGKCGHLVLCGTCSKNIYTKSESLCPICMNSWEDVRKIFS